MLATKSRGVWCVCLFNPAMPPADPSQSSFLRDGIFPHLIQQREPVPALQSHRRNASGARAQEGSGGGGKPVCFFS